MGKWVSIYLLAAILFGLEASALPLSQKALFGRCYAHLTGRPLPLNHTLYQEVRSGRLSAKQACQLILQKATLNASSGILLTPDDRESQWVLNQMYDFHRSWFSSATVEQIQGYNDEIAIGTRDIYDSTEPALAVTKAVFTEGASYQDVLTASMGVSAIRREDPNVRSRIGWTVSFAGRRIYSNNASLDLNLFHFRGFENFSFSGDDNKSFLLTPAKIEVGNLIGVRSTTESFNVPNVSPTPLGSQTGGNGYPGLNFSFNLYEAYGGGVLGSPIYMMMNFGHGLGEQMNGSIKLPRRWSLVNMTGFMCTTLPALRESDIRQYYVGNSTAPFRNGNSCLRCHATLDPMASTARNVMIVASDFAQLSEGSKAHAKQAFHPVKFRDELPATSGWSSEPVENFHRQTPEGRLYFRSFNGELIDRSVTGIGELGAAMTETEDYYQCAAKRYFEYFTGISVHLYDRQDPSNVEYNRRLTSTDIKARGFIERIASEFQQHRSVQRLMMEIIGSDYYSDSAYAPERSTRKGGSNGF